jgi:hypothetical protein
MGFLGKVANFAGNALKKVGQIGGQVIGKVAHLAIPVYRATTMASHVPPLLKLFKWFPHCLLRCLLPTCQALKVAVLAGFF